MSKPSSPERRSFLTSLNAGAASLAALAFSGIARAQGKSTARWEPARHEKDDWFDQLPGKHRLVFDTISLEHVTNATLFAGNFIRCKAMNWRS